MLSQSHICDHSHSHSHSHILCNCSCAIATTVAHLHSQSHVLAYAISQSCVIPFLLTNTQNPYHQVQSISLPTFTFHRFTFSLSLSAFIPSKSTRTSHSCCIISKRHQESFYRTVGSTGLLKTNKSGHSISLDSSHGIYLAAYHDITFQKAGRVQ